MLYCIKLMTPSTYAVNVAQPRVVPMHAAGAVAQLVPGAPRTECPKGPCHPVLSSPPVSHLATTTPRAARPPPAGPSAALPTPRAQPPTARGRTRPAHPLVMTIGDARHMGKYRSSCRGQHVPLAAPPPSPRRLGAASTPPTPGLRPQVGGCPRCFTNRAGTQIQARWRRRRRR